MAGSTIQRSMLSLLLHLLLLVGDDGGVNCLQEKQVLLLPKSQASKPTRTPRCSSQRSRSEKDATMLEMRHHDSSFRTTKINRDDKVEKLLYSDQSRVRSIQSQRNRAVSTKNEQQSESEMPLGSGIKLQTMNYIVTIELGGQKMSVIVDTGSDITWVQCQPCRYCYNQQDPLFNPTLSPTFHSILCNSSICSSLQFATGNLGFCRINGKNCNYNVNYGDGSYTDGELSLEQLKLGDTTVQNFIFGCGQRNHGLFGGVSGLMGLGRSRLSLVSQTLAEFGGVFSYCLPSQENLSGSLILGSNLSAFRNSTPISYTRIVSNPQMPTFYFLNFTGASVGGVPLQAPGFANGVTLIDSGTVITRLVPSAYKAVRDEFLKQFSGYPPAPGFSILDTCFNLTGYSEVDIPNLKLHFEGGTEVKVDVSGMFYFAKKDASQVCLALASLSSEDEFAIIGNYQQKNLRVVYNGKDSELGFGEENCHYL